MKIYCEMSSKVAGGVAVMVTAKFEQGEKGT